MGIPPIRPPPWLADRLTAFDTEAAAEKADAVVAGAAKKKVCFSLSHNSHIYTIARSLSLSLSLCLCLPLSVSLSLSLSLSPSLSLYVSLPDLT